MAIGGGGWWWLLLVAGIMVAGLWLAARGWDHDAELRQLSPASRKKRSPMDPVDRTLRRRGPWL